MKIVSCDCWEDNIITLYKGKYNIYKAVFRPKKLGGTRHLVIVHRACIYCPCCGKKLEVTC